MVASGPGATPFGGHAGWVGSVAFSPDGAVLASGGVDGMVRLWDARTGEQRGAPLAGHTGSVESVAFSPDGAVLASGGGVDRMVRLWDARTGEQRGAPLAGHTGTVESVAFSPDGAVLASGGDHSIRIWNPRNGSQIDGTGFGASRALGRPLAGVRSDSPSGEDLLGVGADVETLADLIAAADTSPPLAIALIGEWGAGKSSVMLQVQRRIGLLAEMSRNNPGLSLFAATVRQVRFNAWHYSDDQVWAGLVSHLFQALAAPPGEDVAAATGAAADAGKIQAERAAVRAELAARQGDETRMAGALRAADRITQPRGSLAWLGSPRYAVQILAAAGRETVHDVRQARHVLVSWVLLAGAAYVIWARYGARIGAAASVIALLAMPAIAAWLKVRLAHRTGMRLVQRQRRNLESRQRALQQEIGKLRERLSLIDAAARLSGFLDERARPGAYQEYRGLLGQVHADLETLSADLAQARAEWQAGGSVTPPPLGRIVLYIDDLDRCPPRRGVEVLEAVHLKRVDRCRASMVHPVGPGM